MERGYIKLWRKTLDSGIMQNPNLFLFWCWCLMKASHKKIRVFIGFNEIELNPGEFVFGRCKAAAVLNLSERSIRTCLETLKNAQQIASKRPTNIA